MYRRFDNFSESDTKMFDILRMAISWSLKVVFKTKINTSIRDMFNL